jgi:hypothetical protein
MVFIGKKFLSAQELQKKNHLGAYDPGRMVFARSSSAAGVSRGALTGICAAYLEKTGRFAGS